MHLLGDFGVLNDLLEALLFEVALECPELVTLQHVDLFLKEFLVFAILISDFAKIYYPLFRQVLRPTFKDFLRLPYLLQQLLVVLVSKGGPNIFYVEKVKLHEFPVVESDAGEHFPNYLLVSIGDNISCPANIKSYEGMES